MSDRWSPYTDDDKCKLCLSLVVVTRGDVPLTDVLRVNEWVCITETIVHDNSQGNDLSVYGRYEAVAQAKNDVVLVVDDDVYLWPGSVQALCAAYEPGKLIANMPERFWPHYPDSCLVGFGAIFDRELPAMSFDKIGLNQNGGPRAEDDWWDFKHTSNGVTIEIPDGSFFRRTCDVVFSTLTERVIIDAAYTEQPWAHAPNRMWKQSTHFGERQRMLELARQVRDA